MYAKPLRDAGDRFRREHLGSDDVTDNTLLRDWTTVKVRGRTPPGWMDGWMDTAHYKWVTMQSELLVDIYKNPFMRLLIIFHEIFSKRTKQEISENIQLNFFLIYQN